MARVFSLRFLVALVLILLAAMYRLVPYEPSLQGLLPYWWNLAPIGAISLFAGACISNRLLAFAVPLLTLIVSDVMIGYYLYPNPNNYGLWADYVTNGEFWFTYVFYQGFWVNYASFGVYVLLGFWLRNRRRALPISCCALAGSTQFFLVSNFGVWALGTIYPKTWQGLLDCYIKAIPFYDEQPFKYVMGTFLGDQIFSVVLFGTFALIEWGFPKLREPALQTA